MISALLVALIAAGAMPAAAESVVTLPLRDLLPLLDKKTEAKSRPPVGAVITAAQLKGRLAAEALIVEAHFDVAVLADGDWVKLPLLPLGAEVTITMQPRSDQAAVAILDGVLTLLTNKNGPCAIDVGLSVPAHGKGPRREAALSLVEGAPQVPLHLEVDPAFNLLEPPASDPAVDVLPRGHRWTVAWSPQGARAVAHKPLQRPPLEPAIPRATANWVTTLEGKLETRIQYGLQLDREQPIEIVLPEGHALQRVAVNGRPVAIEPEKGLLKLTVAPVEVGATESTLEVVTVQDLGVFHLSGALRLSLPRASWPIGEVVARAHLPSVFEYRREGGSLELLSVDEGEPEARNALPGRRLSLRQHRVSASAPSLELSYSVDIEKSYFR
jgi:hypothetical protein